MAERGIINDATMLLREAPACPAGEAIGSVRESPLPNTPGVRCRVTHESLTPIENPNAIAGWCCHAGPNGYVRCPVWQFDKRRIWAKRKSYGDEREMHDQDVRTWREDLTGSEYGDTSFIDALNEDLAEDMEAVRELGLVEGHSEADFSAE